MARPSPPAHPRKSPGRRAAPARAPGRRGGLLRWLLSRFAVLGLVCGVVAAVLGWGWSRVLERRVVERIEAGRPLDVPSVVHGAPPVLRVGAYVSHSRVREALTRAGWTEADRVDSDREFHIARRSILLDPPGEPRLEARLQDDRVVSLKGADGRALESYALPAEEVAPLVGEDRTRRTPVPLADIPEGVRDAVLAIEDSRFYEHPGVDLRAVLRAAWVDLRAGELQQGGSTITQQLAKNLFLAPEKKLWRKVNEVMIARALERRYGKDRILELYLNQVYLGQRGGFAIYGMEQGARAYFGKTLRQLTLAEAATLAGSIQAPNRYAPWKHPEQARRRRDEVLTRMVRVGSLTAEQADAAREQPLHVRKGEAVLARRAPWFLERVRDLLDDRFPGPALAREGMRVGTTLDLSMQMAAEAAVEAGLAALDKGYPGLARKGGVQAALVALDPDTGDVRAWVGGRDYGDSQFDRVHQARRQPGSAFKPLALAAALEAMPDEVSGSMTLSDDPLTVGGAGGEEAWSPANYDGQHRGLVTLREATWDSRNLPYARLGQLVGPGRIAALARDLGIGSPLRALPSLVLGAQEVSPLDLAVAYAALANGGQRVTPRWLVDVRAADGSEQLAIPSRRPQAAVSRETAFLVTDLLRGVVERGTGARAASHGIKVPFVGKTGTTDRGRDAWFAGYTRDLAVVVWVGLDGSQDLGLTGAQAALPIWATFLGSVSKYLSGEDFPAPEGLSRTPVCALSGRSPHAGCPSVVTAAFRPSTVPAESCAVHDEHGAVVAPLAPWPSGSAPEAPGIEIDGSPAGPLPAGGEEVPDAVEVGAREPRDPLGALIARKKAEREARRRAAEERSGAGGAVEAGSRDDAERDRP